MIGLDRMECVIRNRIDDKTRGREPEEPRIRQDDVVAISRDTNVFCERRLPFGKFKELDSSAEKTAHVLSSSVRGFKVSAKNAAGLRSLIKDLLILALGG